jgi:hypothetical protein
MNKLTSRQQKYVWIMAAITFVSRAALGLRGEANQASRLFKDDAFYMMSCVWHLVQGHGLTADGVHPTNGIQPLFVFLDVPFFWLAHGDRWLGVQLSFIPLALFSTASVVLAAWIMSGIQRDGVAAEQEKPWQDPVIIVAALWTFTYPLLSQMMNGLETGLYSMMLLWVIYLSVKIERSGDRSLAAFAGLGAMLGVLVLSRIDAVFVVGAICVVEATRFRAAGLKRAIVAGLIALVISSPWFIFNYLSFGSVMPISGQSESLGKIPLLVNAEYGGFFFADLLSVFFFIPYGSVSHLVWGLWTIVVIGGVVLIAVRIRGLAIVRSALNLRPLIPFLVASVLLALYYIFFFHAAYFLDRYFQPMRIIWLFLAAVLLTRIRFTVRRLPWRVVGAFALAGVVCYSGAKYINNFTATWVADLYEAGVWARQHPTARVGMSQSGVSGFTADNVWNLDGKVNPDVLKAHKDHSFGAYIDSTHMEYLADWDVGVQGMIAEANARDKYKLIDSFKLVRIYQRKQ